MATATPTPIIDTGPIETGPIETIPGLPFTCLCGGELGCRTHNRIIKNAERWKRKQRSGDRLPIAFDQVPKWTIRTVDFATLVAERAPPTAN